MINTNMERMITEQFFQLTSSSREPGTFPSQPEVNPKGHASPSSGNPNELVRKVNAGISLRFGREVDNQVRNSNKPYRYPHQFFQNSSPSSPPEIGSSSQSGDATDGVPNTSDNPSPAESPSKKEELKKKDDSDSASSSHSKDSSFPSSSEKIQMPLPPFSHRLKKKNQDHIKKMRETFSQVTINIPLLDVIQQMPPYARFLKKLYTTKRAIGVQNAFLTSGANSILSHIPMKYKDPSYPTVSIVMGDQLIHRALLHLWASVDTFY